jgi:hypothetical protein
MAQKNIYIIYICISIFMIYSIYYIYLLNSPNLGQPVEWSKYCNNENINNNLQNNNLVVFVGVLTMDKKFKRREIIRDTYLKYKSDNIIFKFIIGYPKEDDEILLKLQEENDINHDILFLNIKENMNKGKTYEYFKWIGEIYNEDDIDFVIKADDDSYIRLDKLENDLKKQPKKLSYWGYLVGNTFMAGECYGLSFDLIKWIHDSPIPKMYKNGHEDSQLQKWFEWGNINNNINYLPRNCYIYDDPTSLTVYSRPFGNDNKTIVIHNLKEDNRFLEAHKNLLNT